MVVAAMNYRLAPETQWPGGGEDIAAAVQWLRSRIVAHGGDPAAIVVVGQSAGASHVADYLALLAREDGLEPPAGAVLISCLYDVANAADLPIHRAYWGDDLAQWARKSPFDAVIDTGVPLLLAVAEHDQSAFHAHAAALTTAWFEHHGTYPPLRYLPGENHLSTVYGIGSADDTLGPLLERFVIDALAD
ncbi:alpha/beta hydrolase [Microbacterium sp. 18062]|uniref:alpha/beta hydrolase n=1 Tax=Microbacterium sp. 18062 TaxID=2681410 RepID=UPI001F2CDC6E|nr:alpha/beta hydrolase fold domain-containing protein [Microbacterium sp. 18062]